MNIVNVIGSSLRRLKRFRVDARMKRVKKMRCCRGAVRLGNYSIEYLDALSFYSEYVDIFKTRIYHFQTDSENPVIIDAGGCIGMSTLYFKMIYPRARITVFEPDPIVVDVLEKMCSETVFLM